jgi:hypothetical protein
MTIYNQTPLGLGLYAAGHCTLWETDSKRAKLEFP